MIGHQYLQRVTLLISSQHPTEVWMDKRTTFDFIYQGVCEFVRRSQCLRSTQTLTILAPTTVTAASKANPCSITSASHGLLTGDHVMLKDLGGMTELNDRRFIITKTSANAYTLDGIDSSTFTTYTSGGTSYPLSYTLNHDFMGLYQLEYDTGKPYLIFNNGTSPSIALQQDYDELLQDELIIVQDDPLHFAITPAPSPIVVTSTATSAGAQTGGESTLTDTAGAFLTTNVAVKPGDEVLNKTRGWQGFVLAVTDASNLKTSVFDSSQPISSYASWISGDAYMIMPRRRYQLVLDAPLSTAGWSISLPYLQQPVPVYSDYGFYSLPMSGDEAAINYAAWMYSSRDTDMNRGNLFYRNWERLVTDAVSYFNRTVKKEIKKTKFYI